jgi:glutathione S-transferase
LVIPACRWNEGRVSADSFRILAQILGADGLNDDDVADQGAMERLFLAYAMERVGPGRWLAFVRGWARKQEAPQTWVSIGMRALLCWYFLILISIGRLFLRVRGVTTGDGPRFRTLLNRWEERLHGAAFLNGEQPGVSDYGLLGQLECMASGLTDWTVPIVREHPNLMAWMVRMHARLEDHPVVHSRRFIDPSAGPNRATSGEVRWYYVCFLGWAVLSPMTAAILAYALVIRGWNPDRSGGRLQTR